MWLLSAAPGRVGVWGWAPAPGSSTVGVCALGSGLAVAAALASPGAGAFPAQLNLPSARRSRSCPRRFPRLPRLLPGELDAKAPS